MCSYFIRGKCTRDDCPYLHVNVNRDAEICEDFVNGYCPLGDQVICDVIITEKLKYQGPVVQNFVSLSLDLLSKCRLHKQIHYFLLMKCENFLQ